MRCARRSGRKARACSRRDEGSDRRFDYIVKSLYSCGSMADQRLPKPVIWVGTSLRDFRAMPKAVRGRMGYALYVAQCGGKHRDAKPMRGFGGAGVVEVVADNRGDTFRSIYTVRF